MLILHHTDKHLASNEF